MDIDRIYKNPGLEARRLDLLKRLQAEQVLRAAHEGSSSLSRQIDLGFRTADKTKKPKLAAWICDFAKLLNPKDRDQFRTLLQAMEEQRTGLLKDRRHVGGLARLARFSDQWVRTPAGFTPRSYNADRQFGEIARFLLCRWPVPKFFDTAWAERATDTHRRWFIHVGSGANGRTATELPFPLTKLMAHHAMLTPDDVSMDAALRWGQVRALGGGERLARAIINSQLRAGKEDEPFWLTVVQFFVANPMLDPTQVGPIVDWIYNQRFVAEPLRVINGVVCGGNIPQPGLTMKGRSVDGVLRQVERWHRELNRSQAVAKSAWSTCSIPGYQRVEGTQPSQTIVRIDELLTSIELQQEGRAMHHCVASYARTCARGTSAIYSLKKDEGSGYNRRLTIEVVLASRTIIQARGRFNARPLPIDERYLRNWATVAGLTIGSF